MSIDATAQITRVLAQMDAGHPSAAAELLPLVYDELRIMAAQFFRRERPDHTLQPTALVHEVFVKLAGQQRANWQGRAHFLSVASQAMRRILINHAHEKRTAKRGGDWSRITLSAVDTPAPELHIDLLALDEALGRLEMLNERQCRMIELRFFGGLTVDESAEVLGLAPRTVWLEWRMARAWLFQQLRG